MEKLMSFGEVLDAVDRLSLDDQEDMLDVLNRRIVDSIYKLTHIPPQI